MRSKKVPFRKQGIEGENTGPTKGMASNAAGRPPAGVIARGTDGYTYKSHMGRVAPSGRTTNLKKEVRDMSAVDARDVETQEAQAKLRQIEALGYIKVEKDEHSEEEHHPDEGLKGSTILQAPTGLATMPFEVAPSNFTEGTGGGIAVLYQFPQQQLVPNPPPTAAVSGVVSVPILTDMEGEFGFTVNIQDRERTTKSPMWLMSPITRKLYTNINKAVPFEIGLKKPVENGDFFIRAQIVFSSPQFLRKNVTRCPNHASPADQTNQDFPYPEHVVRADHPGARYDNVSGRLSVVVPLDVLQDGSGSDYTPVLLRFMCLGSCVGGINRRPISIILTLEDNGGHVVGRKVVDVRVCACPTRDIRTDEQAALNKGKRKWSSTSQSPNLPKKKPRIGEPKVEPKEESEEIFTLHVRGRQTYEFVKGLLQVYYKTHPENAAKYHDNSMGVHYNGLGRVSLQTHMPGIPGSGHWDSDEDSPLQLVCEEDQGEASIDKSTSSSPVHIQSPPIGLPPTMKFMVVEGDKNGADFASTLAAAQKPQHGDAIVPSVSPYTIVSSLSSQAVQHNGPAGLVSLPKHVPVVQVSQYNQGNTLVRARSAPTFKVNSPTIAIYRGTQASQNHILKEDTIIKTENNLEPAFREQQSPGSPELLAANVLAERFAKERSSR